MADWKIKLQDGEGLKDDKAAACVERQVKQSKEIPFVDQASNKSPVNKHVTSDGVELVYVCSDVTGKQVGERGESSEVKRAHDQHSDLVPNVYEGGMKVWECSLDLVEYLCEAQVDLQGKRVIELGCGVALPGLYALRRGSACVHFQDYNEEVITSITIPNTSLNSRSSTNANSSASHCEHAQSSRDCRFFSGDWDTLAEVLRSGDGGLADNKKYDVILTSETIYSPDSYLKLHNTLHSLLKPDGTVYLAAKTYYFGVGGGTRDFEEVIRQQGVFYSSVVKTIHAGVNREVLTLQLKSRDHHGDQSNHSNQNNPGPS